MVFGQQFLGDNDPKDTGPSPRGIEGHRGCWEGSRTRGYFRIISYQSSGNFLLRRDLSMRSLSNSVSQMDIQVYGRMCVYGDGETKRNSSLALQPVAYRTSSHLLSGQKGKMRSEG